MLMQAQINGMAGAANEAMGTLETKQAELDVMQTKYEALELTSAAERSAAQTEVDTLQKLQQTEAELMQAHERGLQLRRERRGKALTAELTSMQTRINAAQAEINLTKGRW